jgi:hypothetical protein
MQISVAIAMIRNDRVIFIVCLPPKDTAVGKNSQMTRRTGAAFAIRQFSRFDRAIFTRRQITQSDF